MYSVYIYIYIITLYYITLYYIILYYITLCHIKSYPTPEATGVITVPGGGFGQRPGTWHLGEHKPDLRLSH